MSCSSLTRLFDEIGTGEVVAGRGQHTLAQLDAECFVVVGPDPLADPDWIAANLPSGPEWVTDWQQDGETWWVYITPAAAH
jgi:hypothetical protein